MSCYKNNNPNKLGTSNIILKNNKKKQTNNLFPILMFLNKLFYFLYKNYCIEIYQNKCVKYLHTFFQLYCVYI